MGYTKTSFRNGHITPEEVRKKISLSMRNKWKNDAEFRKIGIDKVKKMTEGNIGRHCSKETKRKISKSNLGRKWAKEARENIKGENHHNWKGDNVKYGALHSWIKRRLKKPIICDNCRKNEKLDLANISGEYRRDLSDWKWLCRKCHMNSDGRIKKLYEYNLKHTEEALKRKITIKCHYCGEQFKCSPNPNKKRKFCSRECYYLGY